MQIIVEYDIYRRRKESAIISVNSQDRMLKPTPITHSYCTGMYLQYYSSIMHEWNSFQFRSCVSWTEKNEMEKTRAMENLPLKVVR